MSSSKQNKGCADYQLTRRTLLSMGLGGMATMALPAWLPKVAMAPSYRSASRDVVVALFLRGGMDGMSMCIPHGDKDYYTLRPNIAVPQPSSSASAKAIDLDGFFGMHPSMAPLKPFWDNGNLAFVHATGGVPDNWTRSHFDAQRWMELGKPNDLSITNGWLGRHLATIPAVVAGSNLRGVTLSNTIDLSMTGDPDTVAVDGLGYYGYSGGFYDNSNEILANIKATYAQTSDPLKSRAAAATAVIDILQSLNYNSYVPSNGALYDDNSYLAQGFKAAACLIKGQVGVEAIALDYGGWDTHNQEGVIGGDYDGNITELASAMNAFWTDLSAANQTNVITVAMSEFGRNAGENASQGTDHGYGGAMLLLGGAVKGKQVYAKWPGLAADKLYEGQDLMITTDYRDVLADIVSKRLGNSAALGQVFPGYTPNALDLVQA